MENNSTFQEHLNNAKMMIDQGRDNAFIESTLNQQGLDPDSISELLIQVKKIRNKKRTQNGTTLILIGVALLGIGFISTILLHDAGSSVDFALYGLTAIGATILIAGLVMIFH